jgi:hypothetical protein
LVVAVCSDVERLTAGRLDQAPSNFLLMAVPFCWITHLQKAVSMGNQSVMKLQLFVTQFTEKVCYMNTMTNPEIPLMIMCPSIIGYRENSREQVLSTCPLEIVLGSRK